MNWLQRAKAALAVSRNPLLEILRCERHVCPGRRLGFESLEARQVMAPIAPGLVEAPQTYSGALNGKIVYTSGGHGIEWEGSGFLTDRPEYAEIVEDWGNQDQITYFADYLLRAGATVVSMRPVGHQTNEVVLDNDSAGVTYTGSWADSTNPASAARFYDEDYGAVADFVRYRNTSVSATETATATYTPNLPSSGFYPVYTWVAPGTNRTSQLYKINHTGGQTEIRVDHRLVGRGWVYLGTYHFDQGSSTTEGSVVISNQSTAGGSVVIADAIRFGNGMGDIVESGAPGPSGYSREEESSQYWVLRMLGQGTTAGEAGITDNVNAPSNMALWMNQAAAAYGTSVYIGFHSNGTTGDPNTATARGAIGLIDTDQGTLNQTSLATFTGRQIGTDVSARNGQFENTWVDRAVDADDGGFGEIDLGSGAEMDATIIEVGFHDTLLDSEMLRDPKVRDQMGRSTYEAALEYFRLVSSPQPANITLPSAPTNVRVVSNASGQVTVSWVAGPSDGGVDGVYGNPATSFKVYASVDGYGFDGGTVVAGGGATSVTISGYDPTRPYFFKIAAVNAGGESKASEVITALPAGGAKQVLIVNGFDRLTREQDFQYPYYSPPGNLTSRVWDRYNNSFDYVVQAQTAIQTAKPGLHVDSTSNEAVISGAVNLNNYDAVVWLLGTESVGATSPSAGTSRRALEAPEQTAIANYINAGGHLFISGSEIAFDLDNQGTGVSFFENTLKGNFVADDANTYTANANAGGIFNGMGSIGFSTGATFNSLDGQVYNVSTPDIIAAQAGAVAALTYAGGSGVRTAAIQVDGTGGAGDIVMFGFPFESMNNANQRQVAMGRILDFFGVSTEMPAVEIKTRINGQEADTPTGPVLNAGESATFTYIVTNSGNSPLSTVVVTDNNGTPGNAADDFNPIFDGGDTNGNSVLDVGEIWNYSAVRTVIAGQFTATGMVTSVFNAQNIIDDDAANYFGAAPAVNIETSVSGQDADTPTGPSFAVGSFVVTTYTLTNDGNVPLQSVVVVDDNGTPGNAADDFSPFFSGGDTNGNSQLDVGETWTYAAARNAVAGQFSGGASVAAAGNSQPVSDTDPTHFFGTIAAVGIESLIDGDDADSPPGPSLTIGSSVTFNYVISNAGNTALSGVSVLDNNGTPGNAADDFAPSLESGDTNGNNLLDVGEIWTFSAVRTVVADQQTHVSSVVANDEELVEIDAANYLGVVEPNADFNENGIVDAADFIVWSKSNGLTVEAGASGDANYDTQVNMDDYLIWRQQLGTSFGVGAGGGAVALNTANRRPAAPKTIEAPFTEVVLAASSRMAAAFDAAFSAFMPATHEEISNNPRELLRGFAGRRERPLAHIASVDWSTLLASIVEWRDGRDGNAFEALYDSANSESDQNLASSMPLDQLPATTVMTRFMWVKSDLRGDR